MGSIRSVSIRNLNPIRAAILYLGFGLARLGLIDRHRVVRATDLSWPRIVTGLARMSKSAADVAMVGIAIGPAAIAGVGFAAPFHSLAFALGGGIAGGTIALVSQRYGAGADEQLAMAIKASALVAVLVTLPLVVAFWFLPGALVELIGGQNVDAIVYGAAYLQVVALGVPLAALNLVGSRALVGCDDAWTPMIVRAGGAIANIVLSAVFIFGFGMGVVGAALGTVLADAVVTAAFGIGLARGGLPGVPFPTQVPISGPHFDRETVHQLVEIATPLVLTDLARSGAQFPKLWIVGLFGANVVAALVIAERIRGLMGTPGWGFSLASSSLVGQELGTGAETEAEAWANDILRFAVATYVVVAVVTGVFAEQIARLFVDDPAVVPLVVPFIYAACLGVIFQGIEGGAVGALRASGDTKWPLYAKLAGLYVVGIPVAYLGVITPLGVVAIYLAFVAETFVPASITYYRLRTGAWKVVSRAYRPEVSPGD